MLLDPRFAQALHQELLSKGQRLLSRQVPPLSVPKVYSLSGLEASLRCQDARWRHGPLGTNAQLQDMRPSLFHHFFLRILGRVLPLPAARDVYASFSHVNLLFSRHSLHFLSRLLRGEDVAQFAWQGQAGRMATSGPHNMISVAEPR